MRAKGIAGVVVNVGKRGPARGKRGQTRASWAKLTGEDV
jgi:hypothetical protein